MHYVIDIDGTICSPKPEGGSYENVTPYIHRIQQINELYDAGHKITYWTARGMATGVDYTQLTQSQLAAWGCKYDELKMRKPSYDVWVDDKAFNSEDFFTDDLDE